MSKLTLSIEDEIIKKAKEYARKHNKSISQMVESYFRNLTENQKSGALYKAAPITDSLAGSLKGIKIDDINSERLEYLERKYLSK